MLIASTPRILSVLRLENRRVMLDPAGRDDLDGDDKPAGRQRVRQPRFLTARHRRSRDRRRRHDRLRRANVYRISGHGDGPAPSARDSEPPS